MKADLLIVTVTQNETPAFLEVFKAAEPVQPGAVVYRDLGVINGSTAVHAASGKGPGAAQATIEQGIRDLSPRAVIMVGVAFGMPGRERSLGDVLVSERLVLYDVDQRIGTDKHGKVKRVLRCPRPEASTWLVDRFKSAGVKWGHSVAKVHFGAILSGGTLIDNRAYRDRLRSLVPDAIGGEMEGAGLYYACNRANVPWILIKAISDWADGDKAEDSDHLQRTATLNAASFVLHGLTHITVPPRLTDVLNRDVGTLRQKLIAGQTRRDLMEVLFQVQELLAQDPHSAEVRSLEAQAREALEALEAAEASKRVAELRGSLVASRTRRELEEVLFQTQEVLSQNPNAAEARSLEVEVQKALAVLPTIGLFASRRVACYFAAVAAIVVGLAISNDYVRNLFSTKRAYWGEAFDKRFDWISPTPPTVDSAKANFVLPKSSWASPQRFDTVPLSDFLVRFRLSFGAIPDRETVLAQWILRSKLPGGYRPTDISVIPGYHFQLVMRADGKLLLRGSTVTGSGKSESLDLQNEDHPLGMTICCNANQSLEIHAAVIGGRINHCRILQDTTKDPTWKEPGEPYWDDAFNGFVDTKETFDQGGFVLASGEGPVMIADVGVEQPPPADEAGWCFLGGRYCWPLDRWPRRNSKTCR